MEARAGKLARHLFFLSTSIAITIVSVCAFPTIAAAARQLQQQEQEADEPTSSSSSSSTGGFAMAMGARFQVDGHALYLNGFNAYYLTYTAMDSPAIAAALLQSAAAAGFTLCRTWAFNDGSSSSSYHAMQISPGVYDEAAFRALDFVLLEARRLRLRLLLSLCNNYPNMGGKARYVEWARSSGALISSDDHFFTDPTTKAFYKSYVKVDLQNPWPFLLVLVLVLVLVCNCTPLVCICHLLTISAFLSFSFPAVRPQQGEHAHRRGLQGRPHHLRLGAHERAALRSGSIRRHLTCKNLSRFRRRFLPGICCYCCESNVS
jgi:hypothetical protein